MVVNINEILAAKREDQAQMVPGKTHEISAMIFALISGINENTLESVVGLLAMLTDVDAFLKQRPQKDAKAFKNIPLKELAILGMENVVAKTAKNPALHTKLVGLAGYRAHCEECRRIGLR